MNQQRVTVIVVTFNRKNLLVRCLDALLSQTSPPDHVLIVDNASSDGTQRMLRQSGYLRRANIDYLPLTNNTGGAGGFYEGIKEALNGLTDWLWLMDDDATPDRDALQVLRKAASDPHTIYGSAALDEAGKQDTLCWPVEPTDDKRFPNAVVEPSTLSWATPVRNLPFLGFLVHRSVVDKIGLPDKSFFLSGDDAEYCARAALGGTPIVLIRDSVVRHPLPQRTSVKILGHTLHVLALPAWKRYYEVRNRLIIARRYYGSRLWTESVPGTVARWLTTLAIEENRWQQSRAYLRGLQDGLSGKTGKTWGPNI